jgi:hypothetical protein
MAYSATDFQLTHLLQKAYLRLKVARVSEATGGSTTTIVDTTLIDDLGDSNEDDALNRGTAIIIRDAGGAGAAPEGEFKRISDYDDGGTITVPSVFTAAVASGDTYMNVSPDFPLKAMIEIVNIALVSLGRIPKIYSSLTTTANQTEYTAPVYLLGVDLHDIEIQGTTNDANDNRYTPITGWKITPALPGTAGILTIPQFSEGYILRIGYPGIHPRVDAYADYISSYIHPELATCAVTAHALQWYNSQRSGADDYWKQREDRAWNQLDIAKTAYPIKMPITRLSAFPHFGMGVPELRVRVPTL